MVLVPMLHSGNEDKVVAIYTIAELLKTLAKCAVKPLIVYTWEAKQDDVNTIQDIVGQDRIIILGQLKIAGREHPSKPNKPERDD